MRLRNRVREVREARGLSQSQLARDAMISRPTLRAIEQNDGHEPIGSIMTALCETLHDPALFWWEASEERAATVAVAS